MSMIMNLWKLQEHTGIKDLNPLFDSSYNDS